EGLYLEKIYLAAEQLTADFGDNIQIHSKKSTQI
ncbi:tRNA pseudouridine(38-40) synthase TruA, partial [Weissella confusa]|nr:tRNA pseudouridine(38-40) synthase TruA [Weissella confusa]